MAVNAAIPPHKTHRPDLFTIWERLLLFINFINQLRYNVNVTVRKSVLYKESPPYFFVGCMCAFGAHTSNKKV
jgi:hypothetical protein